jgi:hypothetical protein
VAGVRDYADRDVAGDKTQLVRHARAEGFFGADGEHRHRDLAALGEQRLVVDRILAERTELFERVVHRMRPRIERGVVLTGLLIDPLRIRREFIPEAVQIDPLAPLYQPLLIGTAEIEV